MTKLQPGDTAPDFRTTLSTGQEVSLSDYRGKKLVLYFYPKDNTPGCTAEACSLRDNYAELIRQGYEILGVSPDSMRKHEKFIQKYELPFELLADEDKTIMKAYDVWGTKKFMGRTYDGVHRITFVIDEEGKIAKVIRKVKTKHHAAQILEEMGEA